MLGYINISKCISYCDFLSKQDVTQDTSWHSSCIFIPKAPNFSINKTVSVASRPHARLIREIVSGITAECNCQTPINLVQKLIISGQIKD